MGTLRLPVHSYQLRSTPASPERLVNCYAEALPPGAKSPFVLNRAPGIHSFSRQGNGPIRGMHAAFGYLFVVTGTELYRFNSVGSPNFMGDIPGSGSVSMDHNVDYLIIVAEPNAYYVDPAVTLTGVTQITDPDFTSRGAKYVRFIDNYLLFMEPNSGRFFWADLATATDFNSLSFATAEAAPDDLVGMEVDHRQVILLGEDTGEIWQSSGDADAPFERAINGFFEIGCFNGDSVVKMDNSIFWLANDYTVRKLEGATPRRVSTHALEQFLTTVDLSTAKGSTYSQDGHFFYILSFSTGCWVYDAATNEWHERASYPFDYYRWQYGCTAHGRKYTGDALSDAIGYFDPLTYDEYGDLQRCEWTYGTIYGENGRAFHDRLEVVLETGVGTTTGQGSDPEIMMAYSDDGGKTWVNLPNKKLGQIGEYQKRIVWTGLGSSRQRVYRGAISDPVRAVISDTTLAVRGGRL